MPKSSQDFLSDQIAGRYSPGPFPYKSPFTTYHEMMTAEFSPQIELDPANGLSPAYRDTLDVAGSGAVDNVAGEHRVASGATAGSTAMLSTKERGRYQPGIMGLAGHSVRRPVPMAGDQEIWWEYGDGLDGVRVGEDANGLYVQFVAHDVLEPKIYQPDWNRDTLTGNGGSKNRSGAAIDLTRQTTFRHPFSSYGVGPAQVVVYTIDSQGYPVYVLAHEFTGKAGQTLWGNPKLPLREYASNGTSAENVELFVGGREFAVLGRYTPNRRKTSAFFSGQTVGTTLTPMISFQKKPDRLSLARSIKVADANPASTVNARVEIILGGTLTGSNFIEIPGIGDESACLQDTAATGITGGTRIGGGIVTGGQGNSAGNPAAFMLGVDIPDDVIVTLALISEAGDGTAFGSFTVEEEA